MLHQQVKHHHQTSQKFPQHSTSCDCIIGTRRRSIEQNRCSNPFLTCCGDANGGDSSDANMLQSSALTAAANVPPATTTSLYQSFYALAKKLKETQIETLCQAVKRGAVYDGRTTNCVLVPRLQIDGLEPHVIACRLWRWHDLRHAIELKRIVSCPNEMDPVYVCCNPTHWYRICRTGTEYILSVFALIYSFIVSEISWCAIWFHSKWKQWRGMFFQNAPFSGHRILPKIYMKGNETIQTVLIKQKPQQNHNIFWITYAPDCIENKFIPT